MAIVEYGDLVRNISGNFGGSNGYRRLGKTIIRRRRGPVSGETPAQRRQRNAARYISIALTTGPPSLKTAYKLIQSGRPSGRRAEKRYRDSSWYANFYSVIRRSMNTEPQRTETRRGFGIGFGTITLHREPVLNDYITWTGRDTDRDAIVILAYTQWLENGAWDVTTVANLDFNRGSYTLGVLPTVIRLWTTNRNSPQYTNFGDCFVFGNKIDLNIKPYL